MAIRKAELAVILACSVKFATHEKQLLSCWLVLLLLIYCNKQSNSNFFSYGQSTEDSYYPFDYENSA